MQEKFSQSIVEPVKMAQNTWRGRRLGIVKIVVVVLHVPHEINLVIILVRRVRLNPEIHVSEKAEMNIDSKSIKSDEGSQFSSNI